MKTVVSTKLVDLVAAIMEGAGCAPVRAAGIREQRVYIIGRRTGHGPVAVSHLDRP